jgi:hypothetical protein
MLDRMTAALTRRRLGGAVLLAAGIAVAAFVLWPSGDADPARPKPSSDRIVSVPPLGMGFAHPTSWKRTVRKRVISLRSPDSSVLVLFSSPVARPARSAVKAAAARELSSEFAPAKIVHSGAARLGDRPASSFELKGRDKGKTVRALVLVASTPYRTYAVTLLSGAHPSRRRLLEAQQIIATLRFSQPLRSSG